MSTGQCPMPGIETSTVSVPVTVTEATTAISFQTAVEKMTITETKTEIGTSTATQGFTTTIVSIGTEKIMETVTSGLTEKMTATETLINLQTILATATTTVTENAVSLVPTTYVSTIIMTEKMLPVTIFVTSTETKSAQISTLTERATQTEKAISIATVISIDKLTTTATTISTVTAGCSTSTMLFSVPTTVTATITEARPITLTQKNLVTVSIPCQGQTLTDTIVYTASDYSTRIVPTTIYTVSTVTKISNAAMACPLQEKTITRYMTSVQIPTVASSSAVPPKILAPLPTLTSKVVILSSMAYSKPPSSGSICPTPTLSSSVNTIVPSSFTSSILSSSASCREGQKRCDVYDRRQYNDCKGGQWSAGVKMTEVDNMQCEEIYGKVNLVPIPASNFHE